MIGEPQRVGTRCVVLVEGESDRRAVEAYARRLGRSLSDDGAMVVAMGGATSVAHAVDVYGPNGLDVRLARLCDRNESGYVVRALRRIGIATTTSSLSEHGFFVCDADLEDELIRSLGTDEMVRFIERQGELRPFRTMQHQPAQQGHPIEAQLRRFVGTRGRRKIRYAPELIAAMDRDRAPLPLQRLLAHV